MYNCVCGKKNNFYLLFGYKTGGGKCFIISVLYRVRGRYKKIKKMAPIYYTRIVFIIPYLFL